MVFSSLTFLFLFLPVTAALYFLVPKRPWRNGVLLLASLVFYAWGEPKYLILMLAAALVAWLGGLAMASLAAAGLARAEKTAYILTVCLLTANLFCFKYLNFAAENLGIPLAAIALPIGISFYTFQILSYVIDLHRGQVAVQRSYLRLLLYVSCFPQLIAGPIVRYQTVEQEITSRRETLDDVSAGARRFILGLAKKVILANTLAELPELIYAGSPAVYGSAMYWLAALAYTLQIYFDFSGYSDMAIGLGRVFGFHFAENFDHPYTARSITDFWRRWHISLSSWFRDYLYIPLGGNRVSKPRWARNLLIVWALTGLWHGAQWNFVLWGLYYGILLMLEKLVLHRLLDRLPRWLQWLYTAFFVVLGWVIFDRTSLPLLAQALKQMFAFAPTDWRGVVKTNTNILYGLVFLPLGAVCSLPLLRRLEARDGPAARFLKNAVCLVLLLICISLLLGNSFNPFIYFRF